MHCDLFCRKWKTLPDNSVSSGSRKRKRSDDEEEGTEEMWDMKDVVFVEDVHPLPVGKITQVRGSGCASVCAAHLQRWRALGNVSPLLLHRQQWI